MALKRPLVKRVDGQWHAGILEMHTIRGIMFQWTFGEEEGGVYSIVPTGLTVWPVLGMMLFNVGRGTRLLESESVEEVLAEVDRLGWGEPPHIDEVFKDAREVFQLLCNLPLSLSREDRHIVMEDALRELEEEWQALIDSSP